MPVILSAAKDLARRRERSFAALRMTGIISKRLCYACLQNLDFSRFFQQNCNKPSLSGIPHIDSFGKRACERFWF